MRAAWIGTLTLAAQRRVGAQAALHHFAENGDKFAGIVEHVIVHTLAGVVHLGNRFLGQLPTSFGVVNTFVQEGGIFGLDGQSEGV